MWNSVMGRFANKNATKALKTVVYEPNHYRWPKLLFIGIEDFSLLLQISSLRKRLDNWVKTHQALLHNSNTFAFALLRESLLR